MCFPMNPALASTAVVTTDLQEALAVDAIDALASESPVLLVLEDLHWSDYSTLDLVSYLARRRDSAHLMVLGTYRPVDVIRQPVAKAALLDMLWHPVDLLIVGDQLRFLRGRLDVPASFGIVEQGSAAAPAERVGMLDAPAPEE